MLDHHSLHGVTTSTTHRVHREQAVQLRVADVEGALATGLRLRGAILFDDDRERIADERIRDSITSFTLVTCGSRVAGREPSRVALEVTHGGDRRRALRQFGSDAGGVPWRTDRDRRRFVPPADDSDIRRSGRWQHICRPAVASSPPHRQRPRHRSEVCTGAAVSDERSGVARGHCQVHTHRR